MTRKSLVNFLKWVCFRLRYRRLLAKCPRTISFAGRLLLSSDGKGGKLEIGDRAYLCEGVSFELCGDARIVLGDRVWLSRGCTISAHKGVTIDHDSMVGEYSSIRDADHGMDTNAPMRTQEHKAQPIRIGNDVWIGRGGCCIEGCHHR